MDQEHAAGVHLAAAEQRLLDGLGAGLAERLELLGRDRVLRQERGLDRLVGRGKVLGRPLLLLERLDTVAASPGSGAFSPASDRYCFAEELEALLADRPASPSLPRHPAGRRGACAGCRRASRATHPATVSRSGRHRARPNRPSARRPAATAGRRAPSARVAIFSWPAGSSVTTPGSNST